MNKRLVLAALIPLIVAGAARGQTVRIPEDCRETLPADITVHLKPEGRSEAEIRGALRTLASVEAIQQVTGTRVRARSAIDLNSEHQTGSDARSDSHFVQRLSAQATGLVAITVLDEKIEIDESTLRAKALVCIPRDPASLKETVDVGVFLSSRGEPLADGISALRDTFSRSRSFALTEDVDGADWVIDGRIDSVDVRAVTATRSALSTQPSIVGSAPIGLQRLQVTGRLDARNPDGRTMSAAFNEIRNIPEGSNAGDALNQWVPELLHKASGDLEARLAALRVGVAIPAKTPGPKW